jgi:hypothetical protein
MGGESGGDIGGEASVVRPAWIVRRRTYTNRCGDMRRMEQSVLQVALPNFRPKSCSRVFRVAISTMTEGFRAAVSAHSLNGKASRSSNRVVGSAYALVIFARFGGSAYA